MEAFDCFYQILRLSSLQIQVCWAFWAFLTLIAWLFTFSFIYFAVNKLWKEAGSAQSETQSKHRKRFAILMGVTDVAISCHITFGLPASLFWIHLFRGYYIAPGIDYETDLNQCNFGSYNFERILSQIFGPLNAIFYDLSCVMILITYFYRLYSIFDRSLYQLSHYKIQKLKILIIMFISLSIVRQIFLFAGNIVLTLPLWNIFLVFYFIISLYLVWNLRNQAIILKQKTMEIMSAQIGPSHNARTISNYNENSVSVTNSTGVGACTLTQLRIIQINKVFTRLLILAYICIISSLSVIILSLLVYEVFMEIINTKYAYILDLVYWTLIFLDNVINITCISLQFDKFKCFDWIYRKCCQSCEKHIKLIKRKNKRKNKNRSKNTNTNTNKNKNKSDSKSNGINKNQDNTQPEKDSTVCNTQPNLDASSQGVAV